MDPQVGLTSAYSEEVDMVIMMAIRPSPALGLWPGDYRARGVLIDTLTNGALQRCKRIATTRIAGSHVSHYRETEHPRT